MKKVFFALLFSFACAGIAEDSSEVMMREDFNDLKNWKPLLFQKIKKHSTYKIEHDGADNVLIARSDASASGLIYINSFDISRFPRIKWRWKVDNVYRKGDARSKKGDDFPIRVYIVFKYDPAKAGIGLRVKYGLARKLYGEYPPHSSLNYIWANKKHQKKVIVSPYTSRSRMIPLQAGAVNTGKWITEDVNVLEDYEKAFGETPPHQASLAIMNDSDNTGESAVSYIDYIEVRGK